MTTVLMIWLNGFLSGGFLTLVMAPNPSAVVIFVVAIGWLGTFIRAIMLLEKKETTTKSSEKTIKKLYKALEEFGQHKRGCHWVNFSTEECDCGLHFSQQEANKIRK